MSNIFYDKNADLKYLKDRLIAVIGYGNQGRAQALNLRDSGLNVIVGAREEGSSFKQAKSDGFKTLDIKSCASSADLLVLTLPDESMSEIFDKFIRNYVKKDTAFIFAHGFCVHYKTIDFPDNSDIILVAPTGPGHQVRKLYEENSGLPALIAVEKDSSGNAKQLCLAYAKAIGSTRAGVIETTFAEETVVDLFCEQSVLCGGIPELIKSSFNTLVKNGYQPELAYISCLKEVKLIADLLFDRGLDGMRGAISNTARYGAAVAGPEIINTETSKRISNVLKRIEDGTFAKSFIASVETPDSVLSNQKDEETSSKLHKTEQELKKSLVF